MACAVGPSPAGDDAAPCGGAALGNGSVTDPDADALEVAALALAFAAGEVCLTGSVTRGSPALAPAGDEGLDFCVGGGFAPGGGFTLEPVSGTGIDPVIPATPPGRLAGAGVDWPDAEGADEDADSGTALLTP